MTLTKYFKKSDLRGQDKEEKARGENINHYFESIWNCDIGAVFKKKLRNYNLKKTSIIPWALPWTLRRISRSGARILGGSEILALFSHWTFTRMKPPLVLLQIASESQGSPVQREYLGSFRPKSVPSNNSAAWNPLRRCLLHIDSTSQSFLVQWNLSQPPALAVFGGARVERVYITQCSDRALTMIELESTRRLLTKTESKSPLTEETVVNPVPNPVHPVPVPKRKAVRPRLPIIPPSENERQSSYIIYNS